MTFIIGNHSKTEFKKGQKAWNKGKHLVHSGSFKKGHKVSKDIRDKISESKKGQLAWNKGKKCPQFSDKYHPNWKGNNVGYFGVHIWVLKQKGNPDKCSECGKIGKKTGRKWNIEWANIDHKYRRVLGDYIALCVSCHRKYDFNNFNSDYDSLS